MNISEFERTKPTETFKTINEVIEKYETYLRDLECVMDDVTAAKKEVYSEVATDLKKIKIYFLSGK